MSGAQAVAAFAYGTESVPKVDKICGPGNIFVTLAKREVFGDVGIDALYGPSETIVIADETADPMLCAADLLAQAEHDELATPILITTSRKIAERTGDEVERQLCCSNARPSRGRRSMPAAARSSSTRSTRRWCSRTSSRRSTCAFW